jgi:diguanylate cyclase (GGDEF)-like protein
MRLSRLDPQDLAITLALADAARNDPLTGTFHRGYFDRRLCAEVERSSQNERSTSLVMIDIDYFKKINDEHGHTAGDSVLRSVAAIISGVTRVEDVVARYGGEEFAIIVPGATMLGAALLAQRVRTAIEQATIDTDGRPLRITASLGVATVECGQTASAHELICAADEALYAAKREGRNRVHIGKLGHEVEHPGSEIPVTLTELTGR